jgi:hypothetical protein
MDSGFSYRLGSNEGAGLFGSLRWIPAFRGDGDFAAFRLFVGLIEADYVFDIAKKRALTKPPWVVCHTHL